MTLRFPELTPTVVTATDLLTHPAATPAVGSSPLIVTGVHKIEVATVTNLIDMLPDDHVAEGKIAVTAEASTRTDPGGWATSAVSAVRVDLLPLRFRRDDIMPLATHFADVLIARRGSPHGIRFAPDVVQLLCRYDWPGNCLELRGVVGASLATALWSDVTMKDVPNDIVRNAAKHRRTLIEEAEADVIRSTLEMTHWNKAKAAELLEISRSRLYRKVKAYGLVPNIFPTPTEVHAALVVSAGANR
jgi:hypothetical protein